MIKDLRKSALIRWLSEDLEFSGVKLESASSDASFRRYFRFSQQQRSYIVMDAPPDREDCVPFMEISAALIHAGLNVPIVFEKNLEDGFLLLSDLGQQLYLSALNDATVDQLYEQAIKTLLKVQYQCPNVKLPDYDESLLNVEMNLFEDWFLDQLLRIQISERDKHDWQNVKQCLTESAISQPQVFVHRDFHSRNLMVSQNNQPGVLDFQDAVIGPVTYDLVSLLKDCYVQWPEQLVNRWVLFHFDSLKQGRILGEASVSDYTRWFDFMGVQRHLKAIGIFSRLAIRDNKTDYLGDVPRVFNYLLNTTRKYQQLTSFNQFLQSLSPFMESRSELFKRE